MLAVANRRLGNWHDAEDVAQEAAIRLWRQREVTNEGYQATLATRRAASNWRRNEQPQSRHGSQDEPLDIDNPAHHPVSPSAEREAMARIALQEAGHAAPAIVLALAAGYTQAEIAAATGLPQSTVGTIAHKWRKANRREP